MALQPAMKGDVSRTPVKGAFNDHGLILVCGVVPPCCVFELGHHGFSPLLKNREHRPAMLWFRHSLEWLAGISPLPGSRRTAGPRFADLYQSTPGPWCSGGVGLLAAFLVLLDAAQFHRGTVRGLVGTRCAAVGAAGGLAHFRDDGHGAARSHALSNGRAPCACNSGHGNDCRNIQT